MTKNSQELWEVNNEKKDIHNEQKISEIKTEEQSVEKENVTLMFCQIVRLALKRKPKPA